MSSETGRICPHCAEAIKPAARLCPHCRQWLTFRSLRNPMVATWVLGGIITLTLLPVYAFIIVRIGQSFNPRPFYHESIKGLRITESRMNWRQFDRGLRIVMTGVVTNESETPWRDVEFECRFFDTNGTMVDVGHTRGGFTIQPRDDSAFSLPFLPARNTNIYGSYRISVVGADNAKHPYY
jgi:hypothetical protein